MKTTLLLLTSLFFISLSVAEEAPEKKQCDCANHTTSRAGIILGEKTALHLSVTGMSCEGCEHSLSEKLKELEGLEVKSVSHKDSSLSLIFKEGETTRQHIFSTIEKAGYAVQGEKVSLKVSGMSCEGCEDGLSKKILSLEGVKSVEKLSHVTGTVEFTLEKDGCLPTVARKLTEAGYPPLP